MEWRSYLAFFLGMYGSWFFIITNRASDRYSEHSKREYRDWQDWGLTLEALPLCGGCNSECPKKDKRRVRRGSREQKHAEHTNQSIWVNESSVHPKSTSNQSSKPCTVPNNKRDVCFMSLINKQKAHMNASQTLCRIRLVIVFFGFFGYFFFAQNIPAKKNRQARVGVMLFLF